MRSRTHLFRSAAFAAMGALLLTSCGGGGGGGTPTPTPSPTPTPTPTPTGGLYTPPAAAALTTADVERVLAQAIAEAKARGLPSVIAVTDRVGNVPAVFRMNGARATAKTSPAPTGDNLHAQKVPFPDREEARRGGRGWGGRVR